MHNKPGGQRALEENIRRQNERAKELAEAEQKKRKNIWTIYTEVKEWIPILLSAAALVVSIIALRISLLSLQQ